MLEATREEFSNGMGAWDPRGCWIYENLPSVTLTLGVVCSHTIFVMLRELGINQKRVTNITMDSSEQTVCGGHPGTALQLMKPEVRASREAMFLVPLKCPLLGP